MRGKRGVRRGVNSVIDPVFTASRLHDGREISQVQVANAWKEMVLDLGGVVPSREYGSDRDQRSDAKPLAAATTGRSVPAT